MDCVSPQQAPPAPALASVKSTAPFSAFEEAIKGDAAKGSVPKGDAPKEDVPKPKLKLKLSTAATRDKTTPPPAADKATKKGRREGETPEERAERKRLKADRKKAAQAAGNPP